MADAAAEGAMGGKVVDPVVEPGRPAAGLPPPPRWAKAKVLKAKMRKAQAKRGVFMTHPPETRLPKYIAFAKGARDLCHVETKILQMRAQKRRVDQVSFETT